MKQHTHILVPLVCSAALAVAVYSASARMSILDYIQKTWSQLTRSHKDIAAAAADTKFQPLPDVRWPVYAGVNENLSRLENELRSQMPASDFRKIELQALHADTSHIRAHGLLYLPRPYVVPGGRFNEMYGWDSFFKPLQPFFLPIPRRH